MGTLFTRAMSKTIEASARPLQSTEQVTLRATQLADHVAHKLANIVLGIEDATQALEAMGRAETNDVSADLRDLAARTSHYLKVLRELDRHLGQFHLDDAIRAWASQTHRRLADAIELDWDCSGVLGGVEWTEDQAASAIAVLDALATALAREPSARLMVATSDVAQGAARLVVTAGGAHASAATQDALRLLPDENAALRATMLAALPWSDSVRFSLEPAPRSP